MPSAEGVLVRAQSDQFLAVDVLRLGVRGVEVVVREEIVRGSVRLGCSWSVESGVAVHQRTTRLIVERLASPIAVLELDSAE